MYQLSLRKLNKCRLGTVPVHTTHTNLQNFLNQGYAELRTYRIDSKVGRSGKDCLYNYRKHFDNRTVSVIKQSHNSLLSAYSGKSYTHAGVDTINSSRAKPYLVNLSQPLYKQTC